MNQTPTTLITGAARRIGAAIARHLAAQGHNLVLHYNHSKTQAQALAAELGKTKVTLLQADLTDTVALGGFWQNLPPVTHLVHNASHYTRDRVDNFTPSQLRRHLAVNLEAPLLITQGFLKQLPANQSATVTVLGDDALGWSASPEFFTYTVSKHGWRTIIDLVAAACSPDVRANLIALAPTLPGDNDPDGLFDRLAARAPLQRTGHVSEVLAALDYLLSAPGVTGQTIGLGNGMSLSTNRAELQ